MDDQSRGVKIKASEEVMGYLKVADEESLIFYREGVGDLPFGTRIDAYIGLEGKEDLEIIVGNNARVRGSGVLEFQHLDLNLGDNANVRFEVSADELNLQAESNTRLKLDGFARVTNLKSSGNASLNARDFSTEELLVDIEGNSAVNFNNATSIAGNVGGNSILTAGSEGENEDLWKSGNAAINIKK